MNPNAKDNLTPFKKGHDERRNYDGRPKNIDCIMAAAATDDEKIEIAKKQVKKAKEGDLRAAQFIFSYSYGNPHQSTDLTTNGKDLITQNIIVPDKETADAMQLLKSRLNEGNNGI